MTSTGDEASGWPESRSPQPGLRRVTSNEEAPHLRAPPDNGAAVLSTNQRRLPSYASEPPSTLATLRAMAQEEEVAAAGGSEALRRSNHAAQAPVPAPDHRYFWAHRPNAGDGGALPASAQHSMAGDLALPAAGLQRRAAGDGARTPSPLRRPGRPNAPSLQRCVSIHRPHVRKLEMDGDSGDDSSEDEDEGRRGRRSPRNFGGKQHDGDDDDDDDSWELSISGDPCVPRRPFYRRRRFWRIALPAVFMTAMIITGIILVVFAPSDFATKWQTWRLAFFLAGLPVIWWIGDWVTRGIVLGVERSLFTVRNALYFAYAVRKPLRNVLRAVLALGWWALMMTVHPGEQDPAFTNVYQFVLNIWACVTLFMTANLLKTLLAKVLASKVNKDTKLRRMEEALQKEHWLHTLLQPHHPADSEEEEEGEGASRAISAPITFTKYAASRLLGKVARRGGVGKAASMGDLGLERRTSSNSSRGSMFFWRRGGPAMDSIGEDSGGVELSGAGAVAGEQSGGEEVKISMDEEEELAERPLPPPAAAPRRLLRVATTPTPRASPQKPGAAGTPHGPSSPLPRRSVLEAARGRQGGGSLGGGSPQRTAKGAGGDHSKASSPLKKQGSMASSRSKQLPERPSMSRSARRDVPKMVQLEKYIRKNALQVTFRDSLNREARSKVNTEEEATNVARFLFFNCARALPQAAATASDGAVPAIRPADLEVFLPAREVHTAFAMLDDDGDGAATLADCEAAVLKIFRERRHLAASLQDTRSIVAVLEVIIGVLIHLLMFFMYLVIFHLKVTQIWISVSSLLLAFSFMFGNSVRTVFENVVFLFIVHAYDVGDTLFLDNDYYLVELINLNFTVCLNSGNQRVWVPNQRLCAATFINLSASGNHTEAMKVLVDMDTPAAVVGELQAALEALQRAAASELAAVRVSLRESAQPMKMTVNVAYEMPHSGTDLGRSSRIRTKVYLLVASELTRMGVAYTWPAMRGAAGAGAVVVGAAVGGGTALA